MNINSHRPPGRPGVAAGLASAAAALGLLLSACGGSPHHAAQAGTAVTPAPGQSLPGMPGASGTPGSAGAAPGASPMPSMHMPMHSPGANAPSAPVAAGTVAIRNFAFSPAVLKVKAGTTVTWTNQDTDPHTVTSAGSGGPLKSAALTTGATYRYTFTKPGTYAYLCTIHPFMTATVEVTP